jgi:Flp pilus assembly protein TadB
MNSRPMNNPNLRISDAERTEVAEALKRHCADGRLDRAEFEARIDRTLRAKTRADLAGLLDDLPPLSAGPPPAYRPGGYPSRGDRSVAWTLAIVALVVVASISVISTVSSMLRPRVPWILVAVVVVLIWQRRHHHSHHHGSWQA